MPSSSPSTSSFSLPSAGGVVSLLNDDRHGGVGSENSRIFSHKDSKKSMTEKLSAPLGHERYRDHRGRRREDVSASTSESVTPGASPFDSNPSSGSGGESNGTSLTSIHNSSDFHSRDADFGTDDLKQRPARKNSGSLSSDENQRDRDEASGLNFSDLTRLHVRHGTSSSSSLSDDPNEAENQKRRRPSDSRGDETVQSRGKVMKRMLDQQRLASSPTPLKDAEKPVGVDGYEGKGANMESGKEVPMNMHRATARTQGGFRGTNELDDNEEESADNNRSDDAPSSSRRERENSSAIASSSVGGRKATNGSQMIDGKKRYPCSYPGCDKTFSTSGHAARHNRIHTGSKPYRCTFPGCNASFSRQDNSLQHYRTHVLHPKSRATNGSGMDGTSLDPVSMDGDLANLDPDTIATVQMGRKALEEGTAIAVVQEFIDGNGRRAEAVQRMVGQPKTGRRGSNATQASSPHAWHDGAHAMHSVHHRRASYDEPYAYDRAWHHGPHPPPPSHIPNYHERPPPPPAHQPSYAHTNRHEPGPMYAPPYPSAEYHPAGREAAFHGPPHPSQPYGIRHDGRYHGAGPGEMHALQPYPEPSHHHFRRPSHAAQAAHTTSDFYQTQRDVQAAEEHAYHERMRRSSDAGATQRYPSSYQAPPLRASFAPPPEFSTPVYERAGYHSSRQSDDGRSSGFVGHHRRTMSAAHGYHPNAHPTPSSHENQDGYRAPLPPSASHITSPTLSVRSFRSEGPHEHNMRDNRGAGALALLSDMAAQNGGPIKHSQASSPIKSVGVPPPFVHRNVDGRLANAPTSLPPPSAAHSKHPYSSDRSTNILTPPVPASVPTASTTQQVSPRHSHFIR